MKKSYTVLALCVVLTFAGAIAKASDHSLKSTLEGRYEAMKAAMAAHDDKGIAALLAPDFVSIDVSGQSENAAQMISEVDSLKPDSQKISHTTLLSVQLHGNAAVVRQQYDMKTVKTAADGTKRNVELITLSIDTWVHANGIWLLLKTETRQMDYFVNGQNVAHRIHSAS